jgi:hypothetical protein
MSSDHAAVLRRFETRMDSMTTTHQTGQQQLPPQQQYQSQQPRPYDMPPAPAVQSLPYGSPYATSRASAGGGYGYSGGGSSSGGGGNYGPAAARGDALLDRARRQAESQREQMQAFHTASEQSLTQLFSPTTAQGGPRHAAGWAPSPRHLGQPSPAAVATAAPRLGSVPPAQYVVPYPAGAASNGGGGGGGGGGGYGGGGGGGGAYDPMMVASGYPMQGYPQAPMYSTPRGYQMSYQGVPVQMGVPRYGAGGDPGGPYGGVPGVGGQPGPLTQATWSWHADDTVDQVSGFVCPVCLFEAGDGPELATHFQVEHEQPQGVLSGMTVHGIEMDKRLCAQKYRGFKAQLHRDQKHCAFVAALKSADEAEALRLLAALVGLKDGSGRTAFHYAAENGLVAAMELLLAHGADPNAADGTDRTAFHYAVGYGCRTAGVLALLVAGADRTAKNTDGKTAFDVAGSLKGKLTSIVEAFDFFAAHNTPHRVFVFVLCAARRRPPRPADERAVAEGAAEGAPACVLRKLRGHEDSLLKSIAEFAGVPMRATPRAAHFKAIVSAP